MSKLMLFNASLKVLITYARADEDLEGVLGVAYTRMVLSSGARGVDIRGQRIRVPELKNVMYVLASAA